VTHPPAAPTLTFLAHIDVRVGAPVDLGVVAGVHRRIIPLLGGTVRGPELSGEVVPGGADYQSLHDDGRHELEARYALRTDDGHSIYVDNRGIRSGSPDDLASIARGEIVDPARIYFRSLPRLTSGPGPWSWLNGRLFAATGTRMPDAVALDVFTID
jgi:hypothetical protein